MVSLNKPLSPTRQKMMPEFENSSKKRKLEELRAEVVSQKQLRVKSIKNFFHTNLPLETPLPLEWQRCLDIKTGQIYFYNTRTQKRTSRDPRITPEEPPSPCHMSLDLELNLPCGSAGNSGSNSSDSGNHFRNSSREKDNSSGLTRSPSWLTFEGDNQEMVTAVCKRCNMLVMMFKSSPSCPNCKFVHPPDQSPPNMLNRTLSLLC